LSARNSRLLVINTLTTPRNSTARLARATNFRKAASLNPATCFLKITTILVSPWRHLLAFFAVRI
jgi:hypothetical protein